MAFRELGQFGHGMIIAPNGAYPDVWVADAPDDVLHGTNSVPDIRLDADFFFVNGEWWKIKDGDVLLYRDPETQQIQVIVPSWSQAYRVSDPPWFWKFYDRNKPEQYLRDLGYQYPSCARQ